MHIWLKKAIITAVGTFLFLLPSALLAQTAPTPTTTFTAGTDNLWITDANWSLGDTPTTNDNALIATGKTVVHDIDVLIDGAEMVFGTLTLGTNSTFRFDSGADKNFPTGSDIYFSDGAHLEYTAGTVNRDCNFRILPAASATITSMARQRGTIQGSGNITIILTANLDMRSVCDNHTGDLTFLSNNTTKRALTPGSGGKISSRGIVTIGDNVYLANAGSINSNATLALTGAGLSTYKWQTGITWTGVAVSNFVIDSPSVSAPLIITGASGNPGGINAADTVTFQGAASTVVVHNASQAYFNGVPRGDVDDIATSNLVFTGTGDWTFVGTRADTNMALAYIKIKSPGGTITTDANATISPAPLRAPSGFTKAGSKTLTIADPQYISGGIIISNGAVVYATNANFSTGDYVELAAPGTSFSALYGGSFPDIAAVNSGIGETGYFRPRAAAYDNGLSFRVEPPATGTVLIIK